MCVVPVTTFKKTSDHGKAPNSTDGAGGWGGVEGLRKGEDGHMTLPSITHGMANLKEMQPATAPPPPPQPHKKKNHKKHANSSIFVSYSTHTHSHRRQCYVRKDGQKFSFTLGAQGRKGARAQGRRRAGSRGERDGPKNRGEPQDTRTRRPGPLLFPQPHFHNARHAQPKQHTI